VEENTHGFKSSRDVMSHCWITSAGYQEVVMPNKLFVVPNPNHAEGPGVKKWRRTEIRIERRELSIVRAAGTIDPRCEVCGKQSVMVRAQDAAAAFQVDMETLHRWIEEGRIHGNQNAQGALVVCAESLRGLP
jgi:hypothetical protein